MLQASKPTHTHCSHTLMHMLILQGMGEFRASLISSATAYHPEPEREGGKERERERDWGRWWEAANWEKGVRDLDV